VFLLFQVYLLSRHYSESYKNLESLNLSLEQKVIDRTTELTTANRVKDKLLSVISHDIKSPLNTLRGTLTIFGMGAVDDKELKQLMVNVDDQLNQTTTFVENILLWTKSQLKGVNIHKQSFPIHSLAEEHVLIFQIAAKKKGIVVENNTDPLLNVWADKNIISLVLRNLISNAIKFSGSGKIYLTTSFEKGIVSLYVKDNGVGIPEEKLKKIFEGDAESTYGTNKEKGTGLGLVLCLEYLKAMDSTLYAKSEEGKGTTFWMTLPLSV
jgi:signal transduction histidine kinase